MECSDLITKPNWQSQMPPFHQCGTEMLYGSPAFHAADHSMFGIVRTSFDRFGVAPCQAL